MGDSLVTNSAAPAPMSLLASTPPLSAGAADSLERQIEQARLRMLAAQTPEDRHSAWEDMRALIASRSPEQIERMERERGLR